MSGQAKPLESDYRWLVGPDAAPWFEKIAAGSGSAAPDVLRWANLLRKELPPERVHLVLELFDLRSRAAGKFSAAGRMFFTRVGLEQATDQWVAGYKSKRFAAGLPVADLCCGIGGDLVSLARRGPVCAVDRDSISIVLAEANCRACGVAEPSDGAERFLVAEVGPAVLKDAAAAWHIDPDRRPSGKRTTRVELHDPAPEVIAELLQACPNAAIKLAPAAEFEEPWWAEAELEWISRGRQCRQLVAWFGSLAQHAGQRRATALRSGVAADSVPESSADLSAEPNEAADSNGSSHSNETAELVAHSFVGEPDAEMEFTSQFKRYVFEPDPAVLAAKLEGALAAHERLEAVTYGVAYFTSDTPVANPLLSCFEVLEVMPYRVKPLRQWLAARNMGRLEIKKRGVPNDPEVVRRELRVAGDESVTILLTKVAGSATAILARRIENCRS